VVVYAPPELLEKQHGPDFLAWELRGNRICIESAGEEADPPPGASSLTVEIDEDGAVVPAGLYIAPDQVGPGLCPLIPAASRADPAAAGD
jgi:hypothetical protein